MSELVFLPIKEVLRRKGGGRSSLYAEINSGLFPKPLKLGKRRIGWPECEVDAVLRFLLRGENQSDLKDFICVLEQKRFLTEV